MYISVNRYMGGTSWEMGVRDGATCEARPPWSNGLSKGPSRDAFSYCGGRIEGEAFRGGFEVTIDVARISMDAVRRGKERRGAMDLDEGEAVSDRVTKLEDSRGEDRPR